MKGHVKPHVSLSYWVVCLSQVALKATSLQRDLVQCSFLKQCMSQCLPVKCEFFVIYLTCKKLCKMQLCNEKYTHLTREVFTLHLRTWSEKFILTANAYLWFIKFQQTCVCCKKAFLPYVVPSTMQRGTLHLTDKCGPHNHIVVCQQ